ncbi:Trp operon leader peptide [Vibrio ostreicida]|uniref:Trp operon leader peptide n=1 Tax=Vibrio ostreicida TaxID=526588 RepID=A0ABT8BVX2_9VIBR|nr:Trp operon leader peptide [Vibrio ostreicida]MDN3610280.1 Trp operon leader peptide [Vibrio ostreicida]NPD07705.1 Trp operon leader peptide [Vibrio ostreicida]
MLQEIVQNQKAIIAVTCSKTRSVQSIWWRTWTCSWWADSYI